MDRYFVRTAAAVFVLAAWTAGCASWGGKANVKSPAPAPAQNTAQATPESELPVTVDGEIARAHDLRVKGSYEDAAKALAQLMMIAADDPRVVGEYGKVLIQQGRSREALPFLKRAVELQTNDWTFYSALGIAYDQTDDHVDARLAYEHALSLKPGAPEVLNNYGVSRMLAGDPAGAQKLFAQATQSGGADPKIANNVALLANMKPQTAAHTAAKPVAGAVDVAALPPAARAPQKLAGVVMQKVPVDPLAGPVAHKNVAAPKTAVAHNQAAASKTKLAAVKLRTPDAAAPAKGPVLRTAADNQ